MKITRQILIAAALFFLLFGINASTANAGGGGEYAKIVKHLKMKYRAKKVKIPMMFLARFAVSLVRPAGVKSFSITLFEDLKFSKESLDTEMQTAMRESFDASWTPVFRVRSRDGQQAYMYMTEANKSAVKIALVTIDKENAAVIRATINPDKLAEFIENPKIFGISLSDNEEAKNKPDESKQTPAPDTEKIP